MSTSDPQRRDDVTPAHTDPDAPRTDGGPATPTDAPDLGTDSGRHAVARPAPTPPEHPDPVTGAASTRADGDASASTTPAAEPARTPPPAAAPVTDPDGDGSGATPASAVDPDAPATPERGDDELFPDPHAPRTPHAGTHVLGVLVGLLLGPAGAGLLVLGQGRVLAVQADGWDASLELVGIVLASSGAVLLALVLGLGLWTAAAPATAGVVLAAAGGFALYAPGVARTAVLDVLGASQWQLTVKQATVAATSGTLLTVGLLLLTGGVVVALARRHGVRLGAFRERHHHA